MCVLLKTQASEKHLSGQMGQNDQVSACPMKLLRGDRMVVLLLFIINKTFHI